MFRTTSDEAEPNSTLTAEKSVAASSRIVRLQGGGLRFLDAHEIPQLDHQCGHPVISEQQHSALEADQFGRQCSHDPTGQQRPISGRARNLKSQFPRGHADATEVNDTQRWILLDFGGNFFTIQQVSSGRFLEATLDGDFQVVTRAAADSNQTIWRLGTP